MWDLIVSVPDRFFFFFFFFFFLSFTFYEIPEYPALNVEKWI